MIETILGGLILWALTRSLERSDPPDESRARLAAFASPPPGASTTALYVVDYFGTQTNAKYRLTSYAVGDELIYFVARRSVGRDWISFVFHRYTGEREFWGADARSEGSLDVMRKDFGV
ncbi:MAG: hypothetical protein ABW217_16105 [Polyangiaceae bacterium]